MGFLKRLGSVILKITEVVAGVGPILGGKPQQVAAIVSDDLAKIGDIVSIIEAAGQAVSSPLPGTEKLKAATPLVAQIILKSALVGGRDIADPVKFQAGAQQVASGIADVLNSLKG